MDHANFESTPMTVARLTTARQAADILCISERKLWDLTNRGEVPCVRIDRSVRYDVKDLLDWIGVIVGSCVLWELRKVAYPAD